MIGTHKHKVGDTVYLYSRYDGIVKRVITDTYVYAKDHDGINFDDDTNCYVLDRPVEVGKYGDNVGKPLAEIGKTGEHWCGYAGYTNLPCEEHRLYSLGDDLGDGKPLTMAIVNMED